MSKILLNATKRGLKQPKRRKISLRGQADRARAHANKKEAELAYLEDNAGDYTSHLGGAFKSRDFGDDLINARVKYTKAEQRWEMLMDKLHGFQ